MAQSSSRLHRLLTLLDTGSTQATRFVAARQIGDIAKSHLQDLSSLLKKVSQYLRSRNWDTRVAAAHAAGAIAENVKHTSLKELFASVEEEMLKAGFSDVSNDIGMSCSNFQPNDVAGLSFRSFNIKKVLEYGSPLLASGGQAMDRDHRLGQRKVVNVHRLIMRRTLEEKVMSLQKFKVSVANAVINA